MPGTISQAQGQQMGQPMAPHILGMVQMLTGHENDTFDNSAGIWPGATIENEAAQNLRQQRAPMTIEQWSNLLPYQ